jgi:undecaprenyl-diphosphatase
MHDFHLWELGIIKAFQQIRSTPLDAFFKFLNFFDTFDFYLLFILIVWIGLYWKWGIKIFYLLLANLLANLFLKNLFQEPRPFQIDPSVGIIHVGGFGMPSGAAQAATLLASFFILECKKRWMWILGISYAFLIGISRVYLGIHFFSDVLMGWFIGLCLFSLYFYSIDKIETFFKKLSYFQVFLSLEILSTLLLLVPLKGIVVYAASSMGISLGIYLSFKNRLFISKTKTFKEFLLRSIIGILSILIILFLFKFFEDVYLPIFYFSLVFFAGLWISYLNSLILKKLDFAIE